MQVPDILDDAPAGSFSIVVIPDTQAYRGRGSSFSPESLDPLSNPVLAAHVNWILEHHTRQRIAFVSHVGDIVDLNNLAQWSLARTLLEPLQGLVPHGFSLGNKDMTDEGDSSLFQAHFGPECFRSDSWYGGWFPGSQLGPNYSGNNANSFQLFSAGGIECIFVHLECNAPDDAVAWANARLGEHSKRLAFVTSHMGWGPREKPATPAGFYHDPKGRMTWSKIHGVRGNSPDALWEKCYRHHRNVFAVFSGDQVRTQAIRGATVGLHGQVIHEIIQDYGDFWLRLFRFSPNENRVQGFTLDPRSNELCPGTVLVPGRGEHQFELRLGAR